MTHFVTGEHMAELSIAEAARRVSKSRKTLYRLMDSGKLSFSIDANSKRVIDESELCRVFSDVCQSVSCDTVSESVSESVSDSVKEYKSVVSALAAQLDAALERERWLRTRLEEVERERAALAQRLLPPADEDKKPPHKSWWRRLFG